MNSWQNFTFRFYYLVVQSYTGKSALKLHGLRFRGKTLIQCTGRKLTGLISLSFTTLRGLDYLGKISDHLVVSKSGTAQPSSSSNALMCFCCAPKSPSGVVKGYTYWILLAMDR